MKKSISIILMLNNKVSTRGNNPKLAFMDKITVDLNNITITNSYSATEDIQ